MTQLAIEPIIKDILQTIDKDREREIVSRRFGLFDRKETLEQIGELLGITRERVRQLEKAILSRIKSQAEQGKLPHLTSVEDQIINIISKSGSVSRISNLAEELVGSSSKIDQSRVAFICIISHRLTILDENDFYFPSVAISKTFKSQKDITRQTEEVIKTLKTIGTPATVKTLAKELNSDDTARIKALASTSKLLASLNNQWGLVKWPAVNPKNIRDKIFIILKENGKHMHFSEISKNIKQSDFKRKNVTTQAIHNELIKDDRFVLVGRGIYALKEWGYKKGTVSDVIAEILKKANEPLHRDEIVKRVLKNRYVKETTILLNLQGKQQFVRVAKATYALAED